MHDADMQKRLSLSEVGEREIWFRNLFEYAEDAIAFTGLNGTIRDVNSSFCRLTGYTHAELLQMTCLDLTPREYHYTEKRAVESLLAAGESVEYEKEYVRKDGFRFPVKVRMFAIRMPESPNVTLGSIVKDISAQKSVESALEESEERYQNLVNSLPQMVFELDEVGNINFANINALDSFGFSHSDISAGINISQIMAPEDISPAQEKLAKVITSHEGGASEFTAIRRDGSMFPLLVYSSPIIKQGRVRGLRGIAVDITELKRVHSDLEESQERYREMFNNASDAILIRRLDGTITEANQAAVRLTGYRLDELVGMNIAQFLTEESFELTMANQHAVLNGETTSQRYELEMIRADGRHAYIESVSRIIRDDGKPAGIQAIVRDITEQKELRENLQRHISQVIRAQEEERKRIARELHDETAQSLASLLLDIESVKRANVRSPEKTPDYLNDLRDRTKKILEGVRRFSHALRPDVLDHLGLLAALDLITEELKEETGINASIEVTGAERRLSAEKELTLFRVAQEALNNLKRHAQATQAALKLEFRKQKVTLTVSDNGCGFKLPRALTDLAGAGRLGLAGMQERARLVGGTLTLKSRVGKGTTIIIRVPY